MSKFKLISENQIMCDSKYKILVQVVIPERFFYPRQKHSGTNPVLTTMDVTLTEGRMMAPEASVSAVVFHHPEARYSSVK